MCKAIRNVAAAAVLLLSAAASASPIQFSFTGSVTDDAINGCDGLVACGTVSGSYLFDSLAPDGNADASLGLYELIGISFYIDGTLFYSGTGGEINVVNSPAFDGYGLQSLGGSASNGSIADLSLLLQEDPTGLAFGSDALPLTADLLASLLPGTFSLNASDDAFQLMGTIAAIACSSGCGGGGGQVAEPSSVALFAVGLVCLGLLGRRPRGAGTTRLSWRTHRR